MDIVNHSFAICPYWPYSGGRSHGDPVNFVRESMVSRNVCITIIIDIAWHVPPLHSTVLQIFRETKVIRI